MLPTREDAERLAEAIRGQGLLEVLKALQNFELKVEDIASLDTDVAMVIATSMMFIAGELATKLESPSNKVANQFAEPLNHLYSILCELVNVLQSRSIMQKMVVNQRDDVVAIHKKAWHQAYIIKNKPSGTMVKCLEKLKNAWANESETTNEWFTDVDDAVDFLVGCFEPAPAVERPGAAADAGTGPGAGAAANSGAGDGDGDDDGGDESRSDNKVDGGDGDSAKKHKAGKKRKQPAKKAAKKSAEPAAAENDKVDSDDESDDAALPEAPPAQAKPAGRKKPPARKKPAPARQALPADHPGHGSSDDSDDGSDAEADKDGFVWLPVEIGKQRRGADSKRKWSADQAGAFAKKACCNTRKLAKLINKLMRQQRKNNLIIKALKAKLDA